MPLDVDLRRRTCTRARARRGLPRPPATARPGRLQVVAESFYSPCPTSAGWQRPGASRDLVGSCSTSPQPEVPRGLARRARSEFEPWPVSRTDRLVGRSTRRPVRVARRSSLRRTVELGSGYTSLVTAHGRRSATRTRARDAYSVSSSTSRVTETHSRCRRARPASAQDVPRSRPPARCSSSRFPFRKRRRRSSSTISTGRPLKASSIFFCRHYSSDDRAGAVARGWRIRRRRAGAVAQGGRSAGSGACPQDHPRVAGRSATSSWRRAPAARPAGPCRVGTVDDPAPNNVLGLRRGSGVRR